MVWNYRFKFYKRSQQFIGPHKEFEVRKDQEFPLATAEGNRTSQARRRATQQNRDAECGELDCVDRDRLRGPLSEENHGLHGYHGWRAKRFGVRRCCAALDPLSQRMQKNTEQIRIGQNAQDWPNSL